jgi:CubicO group peptidase (beta-lactamase class C family)
MHKRTKKWWAAVIGAITLVCAGAGLWHTVRSQPLSTLAGPVQRSSKLGPTIDRLVGNTHFKGMIIAIRQGKVAVIRHYGEADTTLHEPNSADALFPIASMEKTMTATLIAQLIREGKLNYNTRLSKFYPAVPGSSDITIRELLNHTSGLFMDEIAPDQELTSDAAAINYTVHNVTNTKDKQFSYTNANFVLLAGIVDQITGQTFYQALKQRVLDPLKMAHTFDAQHIPHGSVVAQGYQFTDKDYVPEVLDPKLVSSLLGTGSIYMSITDMATFQLALSDGRLLTRPQFVELTQRPSLDSSYSGGFFIGDNNNRVVVGMYDDFPNSFKTYFQADQRNTAGVLIFANESTGMNIQDLGEQIMGVL